MERKGAHTIMQNHDEKLKKMTYEYDNQEYIILNQCPHCHQDIYPTTKTPYSLENKNLSIRVLSLECPSCKNEYFVFNDFMETSSRSKYLISFPKFNFSDNSSLLKSTSQKFQNLYAQSVNAELLGHLDLAFFGYVKSLEILIKDIAILEHPESEDDILFSHLITCLEQYHARNMHLFSGKLTEILKNDYLYYQKSTDFQAYSELVKDFIDYFLHYLELLLKTQSLNESHKYH